VDPIGPFSGSFRFLSHFSPSPVHGLDGHLYPTVEHAYQAAKSLSAEDHLRIRLEPSPGNAKALGRQIRIRSDWERIKLSVMNLLLHMKFADPRLSQQLLDTGDAVLIEYNTWGDTYWGICQGTGENHLGS